MIFTLTSSIALAATLAHTQPPAPPAPTAAPAAKSPAEMVEQDRLMATIKSLPVNRSAAGDATSADGLIAAQTALAATVKELGFTPELTDVSWSRRSDGP